jgi:hypothetical protein
MMEVHKHEMEAMKADIANMKASLADMNANTATIKDLNEMARWRGQRESLGKADRPHGANAKAHGNDGSRKMMGPSSGPGMGGPPPATKPQ